METTKEKILASLNRLMIDRDRTSVLEHIRASGGPWFESDVVSPGFVLKIDADATRTSGTIVNRKFIPRNLSSP